MLLYYWTMILDLTQSHFYNAFSDYEKKGYSACLRCSLVKPYVTEDKAYMNIFQYLNIVTTVIPGNRNYAKKNSNF